MRESHPSSDELREEFVRFLREYDAEPIIAAGSIPEGHEGPLFTIVGGIH
jgi:hypothetical protein